jgi:Domain of unknown function (DUF4062)
VARPRVFVSSTYYDLKHVRSSLDNFIEALGFDSVLSEKGDIAFSPDAPLDESCYREASTADVFVLIIGGRYGSAASTEEKKPSRALFERYDSITKKEYDAACSRDIPVYILIEQNVHAEYHTYLRNKDNENIKYAHVDSVNVFRLIHDILSKPRNNPVHTFERFSDIESWLREQWAGLFRELLQRMSSQKQIATLSAQVDALAANNATLQRYLEAIVSKVSPPEEAKELIKSEQKRLGELEQLDALKRSDFFRKAFVGETVKVEHFRDALLAAESFADFAKKLGEITDDPRQTELLASIQDFTPAIEYINDARAVLGKAPFPLPGEEGKPTKSSTGRRTRPPPKADVSD